MHDSSLQLTIRSMIDLQWKRLAEAGTWFTGTERVAIAEVTRDAHAGRASTTLKIDKATTDAARKIAVDAPTIRQDWVEEVTTDAIAPFAFVELTAIVSQVTTIDTYTIGIGESLRPLPTPASGEPGHEEVKGAKLTRGWYPTRGVAGAPNCFSAVAAENQALHDIHESLYLSMPEMGDPDITKTLHRSQIELLAARTSHRNDCFY